MLSTNFGTEYEIQVFCPNCGSEEVVISLERDGLFDFYSCKRCKFMRSKNPK